MAKFNTKLLKPFPSSNEITDSALVKWFSLLPLELANIRAYTVSIDLPSISATSYYRATVTVNGIKENDGIIVQPPTLTAGLYYISARSNGANSIQILFYNSTGGAINETSADYQVFAIAR